MTKSLAEAHATRMGMCGGIGMLGQAYISFMPIEPVSKNPIVGLRQVDGKRTLPRRVELLETQAIADLVKGFLFPDR